MSDQSNLKKYIVKIYDKEQYQQSGILWVPSCESEDAYVFTAKHGIEHHYDLNIHVIEEDQETNIPVKKVFFHKESKIDAAVLVISSTSFVSSPFSLLAVDVFASVYNDSLVEKQVLGFPEIRVKYYTGISQQFRLPCINREPPKCDTLKKFIVNYDINSGISLTDPESQLKGISGGGLFAKIKNTMFLCGIYLGSPTASVPYNDLNILSLQAIKEILEAQKITILNFKELVPTSLQNHLGYCKHVLTPNHVLSESLKIVSECGFKNIIETSCKHCNPCNYKHHFYLCDRFQQQLLKSSALLHYHNLDFNDCDDLKVVTRNKEHKVQIICSDITPSFIERLIKALKEDYFGDNKLDEDTLVFWATKEAYNHHSAFCTREKYKNIVADISNLNYISHDYTDVNLAPERLAIMNVPYIINELGCNPNAFSEFLEEM